MSKKSKRRNREKRNAKVYIPETQVQNKEGENMNIIKGIEKLKEAGRKWYSTTELTTKKVAVGGASSIEIKTTQDKTASVPATSKAPSTYQVKKWEPCHKITEIYPNFFLCALRDAKDLVKKGIDVLVPLDHAPTDILNCGYDGDIYYIPVPDYGIIEDPAILEKKVNAIIDFINNGKKVGLFCVGGHGRTGYIAACVLGKLGIEDPIKKLWTKYCQNAIETREQLRSICRFLNNWDLFETYKKAIPEDFGLEGFGGFSGFGSSIYGAGGYGYGSLYQSYSYPYSSYSSPSVKDDYTSEYYGKIGGEYTKSAKESAKTLFDSIEVDETEDTKEEGESGKYSQYYEALAVDEIFRIRKEEVIIKYNLSDVAIETLEDNWGKYWYCQEEEWIPFLNDLD